MMINSLSCWSPKMPALFMTDLIVHIYNFYFYYLTYNIVFDINLWVHWMTAAYSWEMPFGI